MSNRLLALSGSETRTLTYDAAGNLLTDTAATDDDRKDRDGRRGFRGHGHRYGQDKHGGRAKDLEVRTFAYDSRNRNNAITIREGRKEDTVRFLHNAMGQRVAKDKTHFIYDLGGNLIAEAQNGKVTKDYIYIDNLLVATIDGNDIYYIHTDHLGAPQKMTDDRQRIVWDRIGEPFGKTTDIKGGVTLNIRFPGQYHDTETGLDYNYFRTYDPTIGRYTQSDPIGLAGGVNTYGYVGQNPLSLIDPRGLTGIGHNGGPPLNDALIAPKIARLLSSTALGLVLFFQSTPLNAGEDQALQQLASQYQNDQTVGTTATGGQCEASGGFTFRGDSRSPDLIFEQGFSARGKNYDLSYHVMNESPTSESAFIATSTSFDEAATFANNVYVIRPINGINVNQALGSSSKYSGELEIAIPWKINPSDIRGVTLPQQNLSILNPNWKP